MLLSDFGRAVGFFDLPPLPVAEVATDSRGAGPGCLFVALVGERFDGHDFAAEALRKGAVAAVCSRPVEAPGLVLQVPDTGAAYLALARAYREAFDIPLIGVTGSVGKTTTKEMIAAVLSRRYRTHKTEANLNNEVGLPATLLSMGADTEAAVVEMGASAPGEIAPLSVAAAPTVAVVTVIGVSHIEQFKTRENILQEKLSIKEGLRPEGALILSGDDELLASAAPALAAERPVYTYGFAPSCTVRAEDAAYEAGASRFTVIYEGERYPAAVPAVGRHIVQNALCALLCGVLSGVPIRDGIEGLGLYQPVGMRQRARTAGGVTVIEDCYNASPDSMRAAFEALRGIAVRGARHLVLGDMLELGERSREAHRAVGAEAAGVSEHIHLVGNFAADTARGAAERSVAARVYESKKELAEALLRELRPGDAVLVKGSRGAELEEILQHLYAALGRESAGAGA